MGAPIHIPEDRLTDFCRRHHIRRLWIFGSALRDDFRTDSDVDFLYLFEDGHTPGWDIVDIEAELASLVGRKVDFVSIKYLNKRLAAEVLKEARLIYDAEMAHAA